MTIKVYIPRDPINGNERGFEHPFERSASLQVAKAMWRHYVNSKADFALIANIENPPIDMLVISNNGMGLIDFKDCSSPVTGRDNAPWYLLDHEGVPTAQVKSGSYLNPFEQVRSYRKRVYGQLRSYASKNPGIMPHWFADRPFGVQAAVVFTATRFDLDRIIIDPSIGRPWFNLKWLDEVSDWAYSLEFGRGLRVSSEQIDVVAKQLFRTQTWSEIEGHLTSTEPYAHLWVIVEERETWPMTLDQDEMIVGRAPNAHLMLDPESYPLVSRHHAVFRRNAGKVTLTDLGSKHGTWVNGSRVDSVEGVILRHGDLIVLGNPQSREKSCVLVFRTLRKNVAVTASEGVI